MTHKDIYTKYMIEYDKANVTSSYPSFTQYEIATLLDKAYDVIVDRKFTGINTRRAFFESDIKAIADLQPLVKNKLILVDDQNIPFIGGYNDYVAPNSGIPVHQFERVGRSDNYAKYNTLEGGGITMLPSNVHSAELPSDMLYLLAAAIPQDIHDSAGWLNDERAEIDSQDLDNYFTPMDSRISERELDITKFIRYTNAAIVSHQTAQKFYATANNIPWVPNPVCYLEGGKLFIVVDPIVDIPKLKYYGDTSTGIQMSEGKWISVTYLKKHHKFVKDVTEFKKLLVNNPSHYWLANQVKFENFEWKQVASQSGDTPASKELIEAALKTVYYEGTSIYDLYEFELPDSVVNELVSTAITFALENVESTRLNSHSSILALES